MKSCKLCLDDEKSSFGFYLNLDGICGGCREFDLRKKLPNRLDNLINRIKLNNKRGVYDCIVPVRGNAEDFYVIDSLVKKKLKPLALFVNDYFTNDVGWHNFHKLITLFDIDSRTFNVNLNTYKKFIKYCLINHSDILIPIKLLTYSFSKKLAFETSTKYIVSGEFQPLQTIGKFKSESEVQNNIWSLYEHEIGGLDGFESLIKANLDISDRDLLDYNVSDYEEYYSNWEYLSNYIFWDQWGQDIEMQKNYKVRSSMNYVSFDFFYRSSSSVYFEIHDYLRLKKLGYSKLRDHLSREIRHQRITKKNADRYYRKFLKNYNYETDSFFAWLGLNENSIKWVRNHLKLNRRKKNRSMINFKILFSNMPYFKTNFSDKSFTYFEKGI